MPELEPDLVSIIIASYNHSAYIEDAIDSVLQQTYKNIQLIVIDDASTDDSAAKVTEIQEKNGFLFLRNEQNVGLQRSLVHAMRYVKGAYLGIFASDDMLLPQKVEFQVPFIQKHSLDGVYSSGYTLYPDKQRVRMEVKWIEQMFENGTYLSHVYSCDTYGAMFQSGLFKTNVIKALSYLRERFWSDDWAVTIKLLENYKIGFLNEPVFIYRLHDNNVHKNYWNSFPGRVQVVSLLTPMELRPKAFSALFLSQADYLLADNNRVLAIRFYFAALAMEFSKSTFARCISALILSIRPTILKNVLFHIVKRIGLPPC